MSKIKDEQFSAEVEKRLQNLFNESDNEQLSGPLDEGSDGTIHSEEDIVDEISEDDLFTDETNEEDSLDEITEEDLLEEDSTENLLHEDLSKNLLDDDFDENVLDDEFDEDLLDDELGEDLFEDDASDKPVNMEREDVSIKEDGEFNYYPFRLLKSIILSIDWEITDDIMDRFISQVTGLMDTYKDDRFVLIFLHLLWELGKYIKKHRGQSHPNSIKTLNSVYNALEKILSSKDLADSDKKKILSAEMAKFKTLKEQISLQHVEPSENSSIEQTRTNVIEKTEGTRTEVHVSSDMHEMIRSIVRDEFKALIKEFSEWAIKR